MKLDLNDVTVCAIDSANFALSARALHLTMAQCEFANAVLFSPKPVEGEFRTIVVDNLNSLADYQTFSVNRLPALIETPFVLVVQWDGYVINPGAWSPSFREYDYIGARWPDLGDGMNVGNGGFCLRSRKLLAALNDPRFAADGTTSEDILICRTISPSARTWVRHSLRVGRRSRPIVRTRTLGRISRHSAFTGWVICGGMLRTLK